jgi:hypothetical protein
MKWFNAAVLVLISASGSSAFVASPSLACKLAFEWKEYVWMLLFHLIHHHAPVLQQQYDKRSSSTMAVSQ